MNDNAKLRAAESLITRYYEISKIRDEAERIRQFVQVDRMLKAYYQTELASRESPSIRLAFTEKRTSSVGLKAFILHDITPVAGQEGDLIKFIGELGRAFDYPVLSSTDNRGVR